jgi:hypothetical protein
VFEDRPVEVEAIGTGVMLISRSALEHLMAQGVQRVRMGSQQIELNVFFEETVVNGFHTSEDISFCHKVRRAGGRVWAFHGSGWRTAAITTTSGISAPSRGRPYGAVTAMSCRRETALTASRATATRSCEDNEGGRWLTSHVALHHHPIRGFDTRLVPLYIEQWCTRPCLV